MKFFSSEIFTTFSSCDKQLWWVAAQGVYVQVVGRMYVGVTIRGECSPESWHASLRLNTNWIS